MSLLLSIVMCDAIETMNWKSWIQLNCVSTSPRNFRKTRFCTEKILSCSDIRDSAVVGGDSCEFRLKNNLCNRSSNTMFAIQKSHTKSIVTNREKLFSISTSACINLYAMKYSKSACVTSFIRNCLRTVCKYTWSWRRMSLHSCARCTL